MPERKASKNIVLVLSCALTPVVISGCSDQPGQKDPSGSRSIFSRLFQGHSAYSQGGGSGFWFANYGAGGGGAGAPSQTSAESSGPQSGKSSSGDGSSGKGSGGGDSARGGFGSTGHSVAS
jgi:hypothetical protein